VLVTCCDAVSRWTAVVYLTSDGRPVHKTNGSYKTVVAALRNMLKYTSKKMDAYVKINLKGLRTVHDPHVSAGAQYTTKRG